MIRVTTIVFFLILLMYKFNYSYINIYPYKVYLDIEKGKEEEKITFYNKTTSPLRYKLSIKDKKIGDVIAFYPKIITLNPGDEKGISLKLEKGWEDLSRVEHKSEILIEQLKVPIKGANGNFLKSTGVEVYPKVKIPLKLYLGEENVKLKRVKGLLVKNISEREINIELFCVTGKKSEKDRLKFLKSIKLENLEEIDLKEGLSIDSLKEIEIYEKDSGERVQII